MLIFFAAKIVFLITASELNDPENYMPTAMEIWAETNFLFQKALPYASQEKTTIVDLAAQAADINPNNGVVDYISDFYGYARNGWLIGDEVQPVYDMFNSVGDEQTLASTRNYIAKNANTIALNYTSDEYLNYQKDQKTCYFLFQWYLEFHLNIILGNTLQYHFYILYLNKKFLVVPHL